MQCHLNIDSQGHGHDIEEDGDEELGRKKWKQESRVYLYRVIEARNMMDSRRTLVTDTTSCAGILLQEQILELLTPDLGRWGVGYVDICNWTALCYSRFVCQDLMLYAFTRYRFDFQQENHVVCTDMLSTRNL